MLATRIVALAAADQADLDTARAELRQRVERHHSLDGWAERVSGIARGFDERVRRSTILASAIVAREDRANRSGALRRGHPRIPHECDGGPVARPAELRRCCDGGDDRRLDRRLPGLLPRGGGRAPRCRRDRDVETSVPLLRCRAHPSGSIWLVGFGVVVLIWLTAPLIAHAVSHGRLPSTLLVLASLEVLAGTMNGTTGATLMLAGRPGSSRVGAGVDRRAPNGRGPDRRSTPREAGRQRVLVAYAIGAGLGAAIQFVVARSIAIDPRGDAAPAPAPVGARALASFGLHSSATTTIIAARAAAGHGGARSPHGIGRGRPALRCDVARHHWPTCSPHRCEPPCSRSRRSSPPRGVWASSVERFGATRRGGRGRVGRLRARVVPASVAVVVPLRTVVRAAATGRQDAPSRRHRHARGGLGEGAPGLGGTAPGQDRGVADRAGGHGCPGRGVRRPWCRRRRRRTVAGGGCVRLPLGAHRPTYARRRSPSAHPGRSAQRGTEPVTASRSSTLGERYAEHNRGRGRGFIFGGTERADALRALIARAPSEGPVLDLGCRDGSLATALGLPRDRTVGADIDPEALASARDADVLAPCMADLWGPFPFRDASVLAWSWAGEVLEHVPFPQDFVAEAARVLRPGGRIAGSVPNAFRLKNRVHVRLGSMVRGRSDAPAAVLTVHAPRDARAALRAGGDHARVSADSPAGGPGCSATTSCGRE